MGVKRIEQQDISPCAAPLCGGAYVWSLYIAPCRTCPTAYASCPCIFAVTFPLITEASPLIEALMSFRMAHAGRSPASALTKASRLLWCRVSRPDTREIWGSRQAETSDGTELSLVQVAGGVGALCAVGQQDRPGSDCPILRRGVLDERMYVRFRKAMTEEK